MGDVYGEIKIMIPVERPEKPRHFDRDVGTPGNEWLVANPDAKVKDFPIIGNMFAKTLRTHLMICVVIQRFSRNPAQSIITFPKSRLKAGALRTIGPIIDLRRV